MVVLARLLISLPPEVEEEDQQVVADRHAEILHLERENTTLRTANARLQKGIEGAMGQAERIKELEARPVNDPAADQLRVELAEVQRKLDEAVTAKEKLQAEAIKVAEEDAKEEAAAAALVSDLEQRLEKVIDKKDQANVYLDDLRGRVRLLKGIVDKQQWSGKHKRHRDKRGRAAACPICGGLSTEYDHKDAGHNRDCVFLVLSNALKK